MSNLDFAALLCSRLCHDLVSPVGAINNGLEILADEKDPSMREAVMDLIEKSTEQTANKLQFFRLAFGAAGGFSAQLDLMEAHKAVSALLSGSRVNLEWNVEIPSASKSAVKLLLNLCLVISETLIRGGTMAVCVKGDGHLATIQLSAKGERVLLQDVVKQTLTGDIAEGDLEPRTAPARLAAIVAGELSSMIEIDISETGELTVQVKDISCL